MGLWNSRKKVNEDSSQISVLQNKIKNNQKLSPEEYEEFKNIVKTSIKQDIANNPSVYFKPSAKYGKVEIDETKKLFKIGAAILTFDQLNSYDLLENGTAVTSGGLGVGRAIVGSMFGPVGAILGGVTKKRTQKNYVESLKILVTFKNHYPVSTTIDFINRKQEKDKKYERILLSAQETLSGLDYITASLENNLNERLIDTVENNPNTTSKADELRKYKGLLDDGIINKEEFDKMKKELLT